ncbi:MAG: DUF763 domain-containing protein [Patescibacteria group bacterium]|nr:DUF763 domain-containing protein [Patescibacteria group bacterium]MCL5224072.1 DUF763 domain-containing protein [Patescibacteria group bacterium]
MIHRGIATFGLDYGHCPPWLFQRMVKLGREMTDILVEEYGSDEFVRRMADPVWFQSLGTVLAFDWNASGLTTILTAAMKEAIRGREAELGVFICGGKGKTSRRAPEEIRNWGERLALPESKTNNLVYNSKMSAKVDSALVQDGFQIYHHSFMFSRNGVWAVVQQGMNKDQLSARRYHWYSEKVEDLVCEPHAGISSEVKLSKALNLTARDSSKTREISTELVGGGYATLMKDINLLRKYSSSLSQMAKLETQRGQLTLLNLETVEFKYHPVVKEDFSKSKYLDKVLQRVAYTKPVNYEQLLAMEGVGPKTMRALALVGEVIYGAKPSYEDPARYSFAHGGKDATPYPVDRPTYDRTIDVLARAVRKTKLDANTKSGALGRLYKSTNK